jgi:hypothetical protein
VVEEALPENSNQDEDIDDERGDVADEETGGGGADPTSTSWALRGALVGAIAGSVTGAALGMLLARRPDMLKQARTAIDGSGRHVAETAAIAAGEAMTTMQLNQLLKGEGSGDRGELLKHAAREAGFAAATAARDQIISLRSESVGSEGGGSGARS